MGSGNSFRETTRSYESYDRPSVERAPAIDPWKARRERERHEAEAEEARRSLDAQRAREAEAALQRARKAEAAAKAEADRRAREDAAREEARRKRIADARRVIEEEEGGGAPRREVRDTSGLYDPRYVRSRITRPHRDAQAITIQIVDNSGSNRIVSERIRESSGYILATAGLMLGPRHQIAMLYGSDHCDGPLLRQDVDFVFPNEEGDRVLFSTTHDVHGASGGDEAEAFECLLHDVCDTDFGHVDKADRHLILATDVVGHGMGMRSDSGCPLRRDWRRSVERVYDTFGTFQVIGTGESASVGKLQAKFLREGRAALDLIDMSSIRDERHRLGIIPNAALFLMARNDGPQTAKRFLQFLFEKWLRDPVFGQDTDLRARDAIRRFLRFVEGMTPELQDDWEESIFGD